MNFLNECYATYIKLIEQSSLLRKGNNKDQLTKIDMQRYISDADSTLSSLSDSPRNIILTNSSQV